MPLQRCAPLALLPLLMVVGCGTQATAPPLLSVQSAQLGEQMFTPSIRVVSKLESVTDVVLKPETDGRVVRILAQQGQRVEQNQPVLVLDNVQPTAQLDASRAEARKDQINAERYIFLNDQGAVSTKERDFYITQALESRDQAKADAATLDYTVVRAPIAGVLGDLSSVKLGDFVQKGQAITGVVENGSLWSQMDVPATQQGKVKIGQKVLLTSQGSPAVTGEGRVVFISPFFSRTGSSASPNSLLVKAEFANPTGQLKSGLVVKNEIITSQSQQLAVPVQAVTMQASQPFVYRIVPLSEILPKIKASQQVPEAQKEKLTKLAAENPSQPTVIQVAVTLGPLQGNSYPLISGLPSGARVVVSNTALLRSGMPVKEMPLGSKVES
ncbi:MULTISPECIES: efflux RND transporter periplasmic adaptor subunit [unclassified Synechococcus]|uniref:efflux RND transporter periplasmic adaptor subunit n=2 Tax=Synechococcales TaxID=1890424 RepID=UPI0028808589|nr:MULTISPECIES: efflux RND transporter periplasmic adaptor subunit [unclassified Synechococcus]